MMYTLLGIILQVACLVAVLTWPRARGKWFLVAGFGMSAIGVMTEFLVFDLDFVVVHDSSFFFVMRLWFLGAVVSMFIGLILVRTSLTSEGLALAETPLAALPRRSLEEVLALMSPVQKGAPTLRANFSLDGAALNTPSDADFARAGGILRDEVKRRCPGLEWQNEVQGAAMQIRVVEADQGNQFLRYLMPFVVGAAVLEVEGDLLIAGQAPQPFHFVRRACISIFGGGAKYMMAVCAKRIAADVAKFAARARG